MMPPRERIVAAARDLFCRDGIHATGIDRILSAANASKMTLYTRFGSKDALLREVLEQEGADWRAMFFAAVETGPAPAAGRLAQAVPALAGMFHSGRFYGCAFMNAIAEHTKGELWLREMAAAHHRQILAFLERHAVADGRAEPALLARQVLLTLDGAIAALMVSGDAGVLDIAARNLAAILAQAAILTQAKRAG
jgi:AcrR family transcriptional regulator